MIGQVCNTKNFALRKIEICFLELVALLSNFFLGGKGQRGPDTKFVYGILWEYSTLTIG